MPMPYLPSYSIAARAALPDQELPMVFCQSVSATSGSGTQARARPKASLISTRVTVSKVRQLSCARANANGNDCARTAALLDWRKFLRFMDRSWGKTKAAERDRWKYRMRIVGAAGQSSTPATAARERAADHRGERTAARGDEALEEEHGDLRRYIRPR